MPYIPAHNYFTSHYASDFTAYCGGQPDGVPLSHCLLPPLRSRLKCLAEFLVCQFELNLLNQAIYTHFRQAHASWRAFSAPFSDSRRHGNGIPGSNPNCILRYAQEPTNTDVAAPVMFSWEMLSDYTAFFLGDYLASFGSFDQSKFQRSALISAIRNDRDCVASILTGGWKTEKVAAILPANQETRRQWIPATSAELDEIEGSVRMAEAKLIFQAFGFSGYCQAQRRGNTEADRKAKVALFLANHEHFRDLGKSDWQEVILDAARSNDHGFFISLGRTLSSPAKRENCGSIVQRFLIEHWARRADGLPEFFYLSTPALVKVCRHRLGNTVTDDEDGMNKVWRRLGLKTLSRARLELVERSMQFKRPDGWLYL